MIAALPEAEQAVTELTGLLRARHLEIAKCADSILTLSAIGRTVAEDLCILTKARGDAYRLTAGILCFPNRWRLVEKIGGDMLAVHGPVPEYAGHMSDGIDRFLARLRPQRPFIRSNWGLASSPELYLPYPSAPVDFRQTPTPTFLDTARVFLRQEEQSFLKLTETDAVIFSIRTTVTPWDDVPENVRAGIGETVAGLGWDWRDYKSIRTLN